MDQRILIIDGHPVYAGKIIGFLQGLTFRNIDLAQTAEEGLRLATENLPDLLIISSMLSDMDSKYLCYVLRSHSRFFGKIIVQTGVFATQEDAMSFLAAGADIVLDRKEKDLLPLQKAIEKLLFYQTAV